MEKATILKFLNKRVKVLLRNNNVYTLTIKDVYETDIFAIDKFGNRLSISNSDIIVIEDSD